MGQLIPFKSGRFASGLITALATQLLPPDAASDNSNCTYENGAIRGIYGPGTGIATTTSGHNSLFWAGKNAWRSSAFGDTGMNDAPRSDGTGVTYVTQKTSATAASNPQEIRGSSTYRLGLVAPTSAPIVAANNVIGSANANNSTRSFCYTFVTADGLESNPSPSASSTHNRDNYDVTVGTSSDPRVTKVRIYGTQSSLDGSGATAFVKETTPGATVTVFRSGEYDATRPQNWGVGGNPANAALAYDHSEAPNLTVLSDNIHSVTEGTGSTGSGLVFGAVGTIVRWSMLGYPHYWPTVNQLALPETVEGMVTGKTHTLAFTDSAAYAFSGFSDTTVSVEKVASQGILTGCGRTACETPWGIIWLSREGLVVWAGGEPQVISPMIAPADLKSGGYTFAAYFDHAYYLFGTGNTLIFDLRDGLGAIRVSKSSVVATAAHVTPYDPSGGSQGLYVLVGTSIKPWRSIDGTGVSGAARQAWSHTSGRLVASTPHGLLRLNWVKPFGTGAVTLSFYKDDDPTPFYAKVFSDISAATPFRVPNRWARSFTWKATSSDGTGELKALAIPAEEANG